MMATVNPTLRTAQTTSFIRRVSQIGFVVFTGRGRHFPLTVVDFKSRKVPWYAFDRIYRLQHSGVLRRIPSYFPGSFRAEKYGKKGAEGSRNTFARSNHTP